MRALQPTREGILDRGGVGIHFEVYGDAGPTVFLLMPSTIVHSRAWKAQVPFLSRRHRVVLIDPRGNGRSDAPPTPDGHSDDELIGDARAVLDELGETRVVLVGLCDGGAHALMMAAGWPDLVAGVCAINPAVLLTARTGAHARPDFDAVLDTDDGWAKENRHYWRKDWAGYTRFFFDEMFPEPHSTKQREDCVGWAAETTVDAMLGEADAPPSDRHDPSAAEAMCRSVRCPVLVIGGSEDRCQPPGRGRRVAQLTGADYVAIQGGGHFPQARDPVRVNLLLADFVRRVAGGGAAGGTGGQARRRTGAGVVA
jgi:pimeloyl-ACP methyl ester carboxylesterase